MPFQHEPVLLQEVLGILDLKPGLTVVDCTVGGGGHSRAMLERILPTGFLLAIDQDAQALDAAAANLEITVTEAGAAQAGIALTSSAAKEQPYLLVHSNFSEIKGILAGQGIDGIDRALMDLGVSSFQLDEGGRGFSYQHPGVLDMRMDPGGDRPSARQVLKEATPQELEQILWAYGEERWSRRIAEFIVAEREQSPIETTDQLTAIIKKAIPSGARQEGPHPARRTFQALRIHVNRELDVLKQAITDTVEALTPEGILAVITFHSLEDRIVKDTFRSLAAGCICPKSFPVCVCGIVPAGKVITPKPLTPGAEEAARNPRSRSAKLRAFRKTSKAQSQAQE
ncbi:MAG: 16S rRNA (cytosine(1402)-N(4))-methyltransferase RsmH [Clostridiales bacterium]|nr:16S rRNA (cytosine(1402)-N(4))-methyltransferase RsmH [Clostridiales bacterium]